VVAVFLGAMKTAMVEDPLHSRLAAVRLLGRIGEILDGIFYRRQAGFVTGEILRIDVARRLAGHHLSPEGSQYSPERAGWRCRCHHISHMDTWGRSGLLTSFNNSP
jgi:hypothetical protein